MEPDTDDEDNNDNEIDHVVENELLTQAQQSAKWMVCHWIRQVLWQVACHALQRCQDVLVVAAQQPTTATMNTINSPSAAPAVIRITTLHLEICEKLCRNVAKAWSDQLRQDPGQQHMAVVADWIDQVADYGRFWEVDHSKVLQDMLLLSLRDTNGGATSESMTPMIVAPLATAAQPTATSIAPSNDNNTNNGNNTDNQNEETLAKHSALKKPHLPITQLLRLGKQPAPKAFTPKQPESDTQHDDDNDDGALEDAHTIHDMECDHDEEDPTQRTKRLLQSLQSDFRSAVAAGTNFYYWPATGKRNLAILQQVADETPQRLHFDKTDGAGDDDNDVEYGFEAVPRSVWEQRRQRELQQQQQQQQDVGVSTEVPNESITHHSVARIDNDNNTGPPDDSLAQDETADEQSRIISRWMEKRKRYRAAQRRTEQPQLTNMEDSLALRRRPNKRSRHEEEETPRRPNRLGHSRWTIEQIKNEFTLRQREKLFADMIHPVQQDGVANSSNNRNDVLVLLGALKTVGHVHCALQYAHDVRTPSSAAPNMDGWSSKQCRRWFRKAVQERLGTHRYVGKDEHGFSYQKFTKVLRTIEPDTSRAGADERGNSAAPDDDEDDHYWLDLDLGECLFEVPTGGRGRRTLCAFSSVEVTLLDENNDKDDDHNDDEEEEEDNSFIGNDQESL